MTKIRVLPEILANKIAAGEIVERPASVVKELIENSIDAKSSSIHIEILSGGKKLILVRDNGEGIAVDQLEKVFEPRFTSKSGGTGLGLTITKSIVDQLGGKISVAADCSDGASFRVLFTRK